jgi:hypothetical protein
LCYVLHISGIRVREDEKIVYSISISMTAWFSKHLYTYIFTTSCTDYIRPSGISYRQKATQVVSYEVHWKKSSRNLVHKIHCSLLWVRWIQYTTSWTIISEKQFQWKTEKKTWQTRTLWNSWIEQSHKETNNKTRRLQYMMYYFVNWITISFLRIMSFLFIFWEWITLTWQILFLTHTRYSIEWLQNFPPAEHKGQCAEVSNSHMFIVFWVSVRLVLCSSSRVSSIIIIIIIIIII